MSDTPRTLLTPAQMAESIQKLAASICDAHDGAEKVALVGIHRRGVPLAKRLAAAMKQCCGREVLVGTIDITQHRDDLGTFTMLPRLEGSEISFDIDGLTVVLCDEVIYTGRSVRAALDELIGYGRPAQVQLAVLVDRCGRELPIQPDFAAIKTSVQPGERVAVRFEEVDEGGDACQIVLQPASR
jgi:pyrimidine operon attenuation protein / uracil phosphoribosyltransferase